jgi:signal peptidase II
MSMRMMFVIGVVVLAFDHLTKWLAIEYLQAGPVTVIPGLLNFAFAVNTGGAFSLMADRPVLLTSLASVAFLIIVLLAWSTPAHEVMMRLGFALMLGGAVGNLIDRYFRGGVIDFIDAHWGPYHWPTFNIADSAICIAAGLIIIRSLMPDPPAADTTPGPPTPDPTDSSANRP